MEEQKDIFAEFGKSIIDAANSGYKLAIIKGTRKLTHMVSFIFMVTTIVLLGMIILLFIGVGLAIWLGNMLKNPSAGYILVALFYFIIMMVLIFMRNRIIFPLMRNAIIKRLYE